MQFPKWIRICVALLGCTLAQTALAIPIRIDGIVLASPIDQSSQYVGELLTAGSSFTGEFDYSYDPSTVDDAGIADGLFNNIKLYFDDGLTISKHSAVARSTIRNGALQYYDWSSPGITGPTTLPNASAIELQEFSLRFAMPIATIDLANPNFDGFLERSITFTGDFRSGAEFPGVSNHFRVSAQISNVSVPQRGTLIPFLASLALLMLARRSRHVSEDLPQITAT